MKSQIIQNVFKLMLGTSALLVSVAFFIRTISPVQANNPDNLVSPALDVNSIPAVPNGTIVGCGTGIYQWRENHWNSAKNNYDADSWIKVGP